MFQFTRPRGARLLVGELAKVLRQFQFTRPRGARPLFAQRQVATDGVSIHAPARGATELPKPIDNAHVVSIHAPARGATAIEADMREAREVSIHAPARGATPRAIRSSTPPPVSIHAPARGATSPRSIPCETRSCFNSRAREGRDFWTWLMFIERLLFQFTRPRGARPSKYNTILRINICFNSRAREGRDDIPINQNGHKIRFQFTRPRGARLRSSAPRKPVTLFQFTRPRGARHDVKLICCKIIKFQFTRPRGARHSPSAEAVTTCSVSIHAPARGATQYRARCRSDRCFNSRAREGRDRTQAFYRRPPQFQFTRPRGARHTLRTASNMTDSFNSRAREGRDAVGIGRIG